MTTPHRWWLPCTRCAGDVWLPNSRKITKPALCDACRNPKREPRTRTPLRDRRMLPRRELLPSQRRTPR